MRVNHGKTRRADNSPYQITEDAHVKNLTIEPGVRIEFLGDYSFEVSGTLTAIGTEQEPIVFTASESNTDGWQGIHFNENIPGSELAYCTIEKANNSGITINNPDGSSYYSADPADVSGGDLILEQL